MRVYIKYTILIFTIFTLTSCTKNTKVNLISTTTSLSYKINKESKNTFLTNDIKIYLITKWENSKKFDTYEYKIFMPDGRLFQYEKYQQKDDITKFALSYPIYIRNLFIDKIEGKWNSKIYVNKILHKEKEFYVGDKNKQYIKTAPTIKIMIKPYEDKIGSSWKLGRFLTKFLAWSILYNHKNIELIPYNLNTKQKIDYLISGDIISKWNQNGQDTTIHTIIKKSSTNKIILSKQIKHFTDWFNYNKILKQRLKSLDPQRLLIYQKVSVNINDTIIKLPIK